MNVWVEDAAVILAGGEDWLVSWDDDWGKVVSASLSSLLGAWSSSTDTLSSTSSSTGSSISDAVVCCSYAENNLSVKAFPTEIMETFDICRVDSKGAWSSTPVI